MKTCLTVITAAMLLIAVLASPDGNCQDYDSVLKALSRLDVTVKAMKDKYAKLPPEHGQYADADGGLSPDDLERNLLYDFALDMEYVVKNLQSMIEETQIVEENRPKNPASIKHGKIGISGFVHQRYYNLSGDNEQSVFESKRARLGAQGKINEFASIKIVGEFAGSPKLLDGMLTLAPNKNWLVTIGQFKPAFGTDFLKSATALPFVNTSKAKSLGTDRDIGASVSYKNKMNPDVGLKISAGVFNGSGINTTDANTDKNFIGRAEIEFARMLTVAPNFIIGKTNETGAAKEDINTYGGSAAWRWKDEIAEVEYIHSKVGDIRKAGWYIWAGHSFLTNSNFLPEVQVVARYEEYDTNLDVGGNKVNRITVGTNLFIDKKYTLIQLNYQINGEETASINNNEFLVNFQVAF